MALEAVRARLERVNQTRDLSAVLEPGAVREAKRLAGAVTDGSGPEVRRLLGWFHWFRHQALPAGKDQPDLNAAVEAFTICFVAGDDDLPDPLLPLLADAAIPYAVQASRRARVLSGKGPVDQAVELWERIVQATPVDDPQRGGRLSDLGDILLARFRHAGMPEDADAAVDLIREAVETTPHDRPHRAVMLSNLCAALQTRFELRRAVADLDAAIEAGEEAVRGAPADGPDRAQPLCNLASALETRFEGTRSAADLSTAVDLLRTVVRVTPAGHPDRAMRLHHFGTALRTRFELTGAAADLDDSVDALRGAAQAVPVGHTAYVRTRLDLANVLWTRFELRGTVADLDAAADLLSGTVRMVAAGDPGRAVVLSCLAGVVWARFERTGAPADLDTAHGAMREVMRATPAGHPRRGERLSNLGAVLFTRFERTGSLTDLDAAIDALSEAVRVTPAGGSDHAAALSHLGDMLRARHERMAAAADLDDSVDVLREAVRAIPADHPYRGGCLSNLAAVLRIRAERTGSLADLDAAVDAGRAALRATPAHHPRYPGRLSNLSNVLRTRFHLTGSPVDLDAAVDAGRAALRAVPADHPGRALFLANLGEVLRTRFTTTGVPEDLNDAIGHLRESTLSFPSDHPYAASALSGLANALAHRFQRTRTRADLDAAVFACAEASKLESAVPLLRVRSAWTAATLLAGSDTARAADAAETAVRLLPLTTPLRLEREDRQRVLGDFAGLAADAAALVLAAPHGTPADRAERALRLLEAGRSVLLSQALDTRSDLTDLSRRHPVLAHRFAELRDRLGRTQEVLPASAVGGGDGAGFTGFRPVPEEADRRRLAEEFAAVLTEIRDLPGFASFALPPTTAELLGEASQGPVVVFNVSVYRTDALLLTGEGITHLELPGLTEDVVREKADSFHRALRLAASGTDRTQRRQAQRVLVALLEWLWDEAAGPVLTALGHRSQPAAGTDEDHWPRVWWVPGGPLGLLPVHAAGHHTDPADDPHRRTVMDRVVSSYTPTVRALRYAREHSSRSEAGHLDAARVLIVAMPTTPGLADYGRLEFAAVEAAMLQARLPGSVLLQEPPPSGRPPAPSAGTPTKANVLTHLPRCSIVHFACHGDTDPGDPSRSHLLLHDHAEDPFTVGSLAAVVLERARLAYLSACRTAVTDRTELLDEAIHLTSAFQLAGFPHVIGTLWEVDDQVAVNIADAFYAALGTPSGAVDPDRAARALHRAVRGVRDGLDLPARYDRTRSPLLWAAHLHVGA